MQAPAVKRRTCGAAQKGRGCDAARSAPVCGPVSSFFSSRAAAPPVSTGVRFSAIHLPKIYGISGVPTMPCIVGQKRRVTVFFPAHVREKTFHRKPPRTAVRGGFCNQKRFLRSKCGKKAGFSRFPPGSGTKRPGPGRRGAHSASTPGPGGSPAAGPGGGSTGQGEGSGTGDPRW